MEHVEGNRYDTGDIMGVITLQQIDPVLGDTPFLVSAPGERFGTWQSKEFLDAATFLTPERKSAFPGPVAMPCPTCQASTAFVSPRPAVGDKFFWTCSQCGECVVVPDVTVAGYNKAPEQESQDADNMNGYHEALAQLLTVAFRPLNPVRNGNVHDALVSAVMRQKNFTAPQKRAILLRINGAMRNALVSVLLEELP